MQIKSFPSILIILVITHSRNLFNHENEYRDFGHESFEHERFEEKEGSF
jgi:hypothetical protein